MHSGRAMVTHPLEHKQVRHGRRYRIINVAKEIRRSTRAVKTAPPN